MRSLLWCAVCACALVWLTGCDVTVDPSGTGGTGGANGCEPPPPTGTCSDPLKAYEPNGAGSFSPFGDAPLAARLEPFRSATVCRTLIVGLYAGDGCAIPAVFSVSTWSQTTSVPSMEVPQAIGLDTASADVIQLGGGAAEYRFPLKQNYAACAYPFIGLWRQDGVCGVRVRPACDESKAWQRTSDGWRMLSDDGGEAEQLYFGVADCEDE